MGDLFEIKVPSNESAPLDVPELQSEAEGEGADPHLVVLCSLLAIALLTVCYFAGEIVLPIVLAFVLSLLFQPAMRLATKLRIPSALAALILILAIFGTIVAVGAALSAPAAAWAGKLPGGIARLEERLHFLAQPIQTLQAFFQQFEAAGSAGAGAGTAAAVEAALLKGTQHFASGFFETLLILFFLLLSGDTFLRRLVEIVPTFKDKRRVVALSQQIEENISAYLVTVTLMNAAVGAATAAAMWACGLGDPLLWGGVAFFLNYVPILGPFAGVGLFLLAGLLTMDGPWQALLPAGIYLAIHLIEGEALTPMLLARRFTLNPVIVIISLMFWFWMWGVIGAVLAVPMVAIAKIICDGVKPLAALGHFLEG
jgi:predicted PurR-regulated permease PerM